MGTFEDLINQANGYPKTEKTKSEKKKKSFEDLVADGANERQREEISKIDSDYINNFLDRSNSFFESAAKDYDSVGWENASQLYRKHKSYLDSLYTQRDAIKGWISQNLNSFDYDTYDNLTSALSDFNTNAERIMGAFKEAGEYYSPEKNQDAYLAYVDHKNKMDYDLDAGKQKIDDLERAISLGKDIEGIDHDVPGEMTYEYEKILSAYGLTENDDLEALLTQENVMYNQAKLTQDSVILSSANDSSSEHYDPEFEKLSVYVPTEGKKLIPDYEDIAYEMINGNKDVNLASGQAWGKISDVEYTRLLTATEHMDEKERALYNYWYAKGGYDAAEAYLDSIMYDLNSREAGAEYEKVKGKLALELLYSIPAGFDAANTGLQSLFNTEGEYRAPSSTQMAYGAIQEDLEARSPLAKFASDAMYTISNMAPSIAVSTAVGVINPKAGELAGSLVLGASAAGNAYQEKLNLGYSKEQARSYGLMVGASEIVMEKLLGGISKLGGGALSNTVLKNLDKVDNVLARVAKSTGGKIFMNATSEAIEEGLQTILEPHLWQIVSGEDYSVEMEEVLYSALLGFVTGGVFEGANASFETVAKNNATQKQYGAVQGELVAEGLEIDPDSKFAQRMQSKLDAGKDLSGRQINKLLKRNESGLVNNDISSIQKAAEATLTKYGEKGDVRAISEALAKQAAGKHLSKAEKALISESKYGQRVANELNPDNIQSGDFTSAWAESIDTQRINVAEYSKLVQDAQAETSEPGKAVETASKVADEATDSTAVQELKSEIEFLKQVSQNPSVSMEKRTEAFRSLEEAEQQLKAIESGAEAKGTGKKVKVVPVVSAPSVSIEEASKKYGAQAKAMVATYNQGQDVAKFDRAYGIAYEMGKSDVGVHYAVNSEATSYLTQAQRELAYAQGSFAGKNGAKSLDAKNKPNGTGNGVRRKGAVKLEGIKASEFRKMLKDSNDPRGKAAKVLMTIAEVTGIDIVLFKSQVDASGRYVGEQGKFVWKDDTIYIDLNAGLSYGSDAGEFTKYAMLRTFAHEFTHFMEKNAATQYTEFRKLVFAEMTKKGENVDYLIKRKQLQYKDEKLSYEAASREVVADAMGDILRDSKFVENLAQKHNSLFKTLLDQFKRFIRNIRSYFNSLADNPSPEAKALKEEINGTMKYLDSIVEMFDKVAMEAVENYQQRVTGEDVIAELTPGEEGVVVDKDGEPVAYSTEDGTVMLSIRTYEDEGRAEFRKYLEKCVKNKSLTEAEMTEMLDGIEEVYNTCKEFKDKYAPFSAWSDAEVIRDTRGKPVFSVVTPNGEYKMNLDFSLVCKKRRTLDAVFNEMSKRGIIDDFELGKKTVVKINELIRKYKFETACNLCFVDAKRYRQADVADSVVRLYNDLVQSLVPEEHIGSIERFNFAGYATIKPVADGIHTWPNSKLDFSHINEVLKQYEKDTVEAKAARYIKNNPEARKLLLRGDFMSSGGFDAVKSQNQNIMSLYNSKKGTGGPKAAFGDVQYMNEVIKKARWWTPAKAYDVGGVRIQSFSDYVPRMVFDYVQMIYDLAATKLPAHAYTKEALFVMQFGLTGVKINMSLIPAVVKGGIAPGLDANGNYAWAGESFDFETAKAIQKAPGYSENCGTIAVGVSYEHILKLLRDPDIRMVIPYHKSGLNPVVAHMNKIAEFTDYTSLKTNPKGCQSTMDAEGNKVEKDFDFNKTLRAVGDPKLAADKYLQWCDDPAHGYTPKFAEFRREENYYKLLVDFTVYDESGTYVPQREVRAVFPKEGETFGSMKDLIKSGLKEDALIQGKRDALIPKMVDEIERTIARTEAEIPDDEQVEQADHDVEAELMDENRVQKSIRTYDSVEEMDSDYLDAVDSEDVETQKQMVAEAAKRAMPDTVVVDTKGDLMLMYHGTANGGAFTVFEGNKLSNESRTSQIGQGFYFTNSKADAEAYTKNVDIYGRVSKGSNPHLHQVYLNITNPFDVRKDTLDLDKVKSVYMDGGYDYFYDNWIPFYLDKKSVNGKTFTKADLKAMSREDRVSAFVDYYSKFGSKEVLSNMVRAFGSQNQGALLESMKNRLGYDGIVEEYKPGLFQYVAFSSEQIKSADPVTYDDNGNVIPLSERFNEENNDIRYQKRTNTLTDHEILDMAAKELDTSKLTDAEKTALGIFQKRVDKLKALKEERQKQGSIFYEHQFGANKDTAKATAARNRMTVLDKQITKASAEVLGLEDKKVLKDVLQKSRKVIEQKERKESLERIRVAREEVRAKERERANEKLEALRQKKNERIAEVRAEERQKAHEKAEEKVENRKKTEIRVKIQKQLSELNSLLQNGNKKKNVKHGMKDTASALLAYGELLFSEDTNVSPETMVRNGIETDLTDKESQLLNEYTDLLEKRDLYLGQINEAASGTDANKDARIEGLQKMVDIINQKKLPALIKKLEGVFERERARLNKVTFSAVLKDLTDSYKALEKSKDPFVSGAYNAYVYDRLVAMNNPNAGVATTIKDMSLAQLAELNDAIKMVVTSIKNANALFRNGQKEVLSERAEQVFMEIRKLYRNGGDPTAFKHAVTDKIKSFAWNELKPIYAFERIGSDKFTELFWDVINGESEYGLECDKAADFVRELRESSGYKKWDFDKVKVFKTADGQDFKLTLGDMMSIYAYSRRDQAHKHMFEGGFTFHTGKTETYKDTDGKKRVRLVSEDTYRMTPELLDKILSSLNKEQKAYAEAMQDYLTKLGEMGNKVSRILYGIDLFKETHYFPLKSDRDYRSTVETQLNQTQTAASLVNIGMAKETVPEASNPIVLQRFDDVAVQHIDQMLKYSSMVLPIENLRKVMDFAPGEFGTWNAPVKKLISTVHGVSASQYVNQWITDLNGSSGLDGAKNPLSSMFARSKKVAVAGNLSVVSQQYFAVARAMSEIDGKYFFSSDGKTDGSQWEELKKWAGVAVIKDIGGFDMGSARSATEYIGKAGAKTGIGDKIDKAASYGSAKMDELGWGTIWRAAKAEIADTTDLKVGTEEFFKASAKRFTEIVVKTQVYDSVTARSGFMRSKRDSVKYLVSFMGEPTTTVNMMLNAQMKLIRAKRSGNKADLKKARAYMARTSGAVILSTVLGIIAKSVVYAMRDDDEAESFLERYVKQIGSSFHQELNPLNLLPVARDIMSMIQGRDIERPDIALINSTIKAFKKALKADENQLEAWVDVVLSVGNLLGVPLKNVLRDGAGVARLIGDMTDGIGAKDLGKTFFKEGFLGKESTKNENLYAAIITEDTARLDVLKKGYKSDTDYTNAVRKALRECDDRIQVAAKARFEGDTMTFMELAKEIIAEGNFIQDDVVAAIMAEVTAMENEAAGEKESSPKVYSMYTVADYLSVVDQPKASKEIKDYLINKYLDKGKTNAEAEAEFKSDLKDQVKTWYTDEESETRITKQQAMDMLKKYVGMSSDEVTSTINQWSSKVVTGIAYDDIKDEFVAGRISASRAIEMRVRYGGKSTEDARKEVEAWDFEKKYGFSYSNRVDAFLNGDISSSEMRTALMEYGGMSGTEADDTIKAYEWMKRNPRYNLSVSDVKVYIKPIEGLGYSLEHAGVSPDTYVQYKDLRSNCKGVDANGDGKADSGSVKAEILEAIDSLPISDSQKDALYYLNGWAASKIWQAPWH